MMPVLIICLQILGTMAVLAEIMIPSMGLLTVVAVGFFAGSYYCVQQTSPDMLFVLFGINVFSIPATLLFGVTLLGKSRLALRATIKEDGTLKATCAVGDQGNALTDLRPSGKIEVGTKVIDVLSMGDYIPKGSAVVVCSIDNAGIHVVKEDVENLS